LRLAVFENSANEACRLCKYTGNLRGELLALLEQNALQKQANVRSFREELQVTGKQRLQAGDRRSFLGEWLLYNLLPSGADLFQNRLEKLLSTVKCQ